MGKITRGEFRQLAGYVAVQERNLAKYARYETRTRDRQLAPQRGGIEAILQALESMATDLRQDREPEPPLTQPDLAKLAMRISSYLVDARRILNQPRGVYRPDAQAALNAG